jgi:hypothetical protein
MSAIIALPQNVSRTTFLKIGAQAGKQIDKLKEKFTIFKVCDWLGGGHRSPKHYLRTKTGEISVKDIRLIKQNSEISIVKLEANDDITVEVTKSARNILIELNKKKEFKSACEIMGFEGNYLKKIKNGGISSISKGDADIIEEHFGTSIFYVSEIFNRACAESIEEPFEPDLLTTFKTGPNIKEKYHALPALTRSRIRKSLSAKTVKQLCYTSSISARTAFIINEISKDFINTSVENLDSVAYSKEIQEQFIGLLKSNDSFTSRIAQMSKTARITIEGMQNGRKRSISYDVAKNLNGILPQSLFDFTKIIDEAKQKALEFYKQQIDEEENLSTRSSAKKRKAVAVTSANEIVTDEKIVHQNKKQKVGHPQPAEEQLDLDAPMDFDASLSQILAKLESSATNPQHP